MKNGRHREPKDSEVPVRERPEEIGAAAIEYVGDDAARDSPGGVGRRGTSGGVKACTRKT